METLPAPAYAFKEWRVIVGALGAGEQILILRKGGIAEGKGGFAVKAESFWLFPTDFHAQLEKTKPAAAKWFSARPTSSAPPSHTPESAIEIRYLARVVRSAFLSDWSAVNRLDTAHVWSEATVRERFEWSKPPGIFALAVRVYRLETAFAAPLSPELAGCKSWVPLAGNAEVRAEPVLTDGEFFAKFSSLGL